ncbi:MAG: DUF5320 family protein [Desulfobulbaceae bacterium]|nr:DUF5320 family protein [Desulfobulbaceae bacterium]MCK5544790.1 DUF5320 family protein [Desulfobulbaceae bacterium]
MKTALTIWGKRISPVFDSARVLLVTEIKNGKMVSRHYEPFDPDRPWCLADKLAEQNIEVLICGAISELPANIIKTAGIKLISFVTGQADEILEAYTKAVSIRHIFQMPGCRRKRSRQGKRKGVTCMPRGDGTGPQGQGPRTGKGQGGCKSNQGVQGSDKNSAQGKGRGKGDGQGRGDKK